MSASRNELAKLVSYVFQAVGRRRISEDDWVRLLSLERKWVAPSKARRLAGTAREAGLLRNAGDRDYEIGLEAEGLALPVDYRPDLEAMEAAVAGPAATAEAGLPLFRRIVRAVAAGLKVTEPEVIGRVNATQQAVGGLITIEAAALYYGALQGVDVGAFLDEVGATLRA